MPRRPGEVGLYSLIGMLDSFKEILDPLAGSQGHHRPLPTAVGGDEPPAHPPPLRFHRASC